MNSLPFEEVVPDASPDAVELLKQFLIYPPDQRISASKVSNSILSN